MPKFNVTMTAPVSIVITVEVPEGHDYQDAIEEALEQRNQTVDSLCHQCAGWNKPWGREEGDEWEPVYVSDGAGESVWSNFANEGEKTYK